MVVIISTSQPCPPVFTIGPIPLFLGRGVGKIAPQIKFLDVGVYAPFPVGFYACRGEVPADICIIPLLCSDPLKFFNVSCDPEDLPLTDAPVLFFNIAEVCEEPEPGPPVSFAVEESEEDVPLEPVLFFNVADEDGDC